LRTAPPALAVRFDGSPLPAPAVLPLLEAAELVLVGPSNPYVSIDPIVSLPGVREVLARRRFVAVSPIVSGAAVKGPLAEMIRTLRGEAPTAGAVAAHYGPLLRGMVVERGDEATVTSVETFATATVMKTRDHARRLATEVLAFAEGLGR
jgi:LPPG:FO 2-phospho-L-lactate transferase